VLGVTPAASLLAVDPTVPADRPALLSGSFSLLELGLLSPLAERSTQGPIGFFARDPLGSGRLDGSRFDRSLANRRPEAGPVDVGVLRREFAPVLELDFLTEGGRRTLAQASLGFVLRWPWTCATIVPLPSPERLNDLLAADQAPAITDAEADRVLALGR
jgi:aryl-alcohol dehydrogenase-like predicted oxidoreductase